MICSFTGHRPKKLKLETADNGLRLNGLKAALKKEIINKIESGTDTFMSGMALGIDLIAAEVVVKLKELYPHIKLIAVVPCEDQERRWRERNVLAYTDVLARCDETVVLSEKYTPYCMHVRNKYLVDHADSMIAVWDGTDGGTANTVKIARKKGVPVTVIDPFTFEGVEDITLLQSAGEADGVLEE